MDGCLPFIMQDMETSFIRLNNILIFIESCHWKHQKKTSSIKDIENHSSQSKYKNKVLNIFNDIDIVKVGIIDKDIVKVGLIDEDIVKVGLIDKDIVKVG